MFFHFFSLKTPKISLKSIENGVEGPIYMIQGSKSDALTCLLKLLLHLIHSQGTRKMASAFAMIIALNDCVNNGCYSP